MKGTVKEIKQEVHIFLLGTSVKGIAKITKTTAWILRVVWFLALIIGTVTAYVLLQKLFTAYLGMLSSVVFTLTFIFYF